MLEGAFTWNANVPFWPGATTDSVSWAGRDEPSQLPGLNWLALSAGLYVPMRIGYLPVLYQYVLPVFFRVMVPLAVAPDAREPGNELLTRLELKLPFTTVVPKNNPGSFIHVLPSARRLKYSL